MFTNFDVTPSFLFTVLLACNKLQPSKTQVDCSNYPCYWGGTCEPGPPDMCNCPAGFVQPFCTISCQQFPCVNGDCDGDVCNCPPNFAGPTCESAIAAYLSPLEITVTEGHVGEKAVTVQVCRQPSSEAVTLEVYTSTISAVEGSDFESIPLFPRREVTISARQTCTSVNVFIISDTTSEMISKSFRFIMLVPQSSSMVHLVPGNSHTTITITDDDPDADECAFPGTNMCDSSSSTCVNTIGSYRCECNSGYTGSPYTPPEQPTCADRDECAFSIFSDMCDSSSSTCSNTMGSYICVCKPGYTGSTYTPGQQSTCTDLDECTISFFSNMCDSSSSTCMNTIGSYRCVCKSGYTGSPYTPPGQQSTCTDRDECTFSILSDMCDSSSTCMNTIGSYICMCKSGYTGSPYTPGQQSTCTDQDECTFNMLSDMCDSSSSTCMNTIGSYICVCKPGYTGSAYTPGQQSTCTDNTPPIISDCPSSSVVGAVSQDGDSVAISWTEPTATDNSGTVTTMSSHGPGQQFSIGSTTVTYTFMDAAGNSDMCSFPVSVVEIILQCPGTVTVIAGSQVSFINPTCITISTMQVSSSSCVPADGSTISSDTLVSCSCDSFPNIQCSFEVFVTDITSESLSQVNPQSSVEIKCILEGSSSVVNSLEIRLSRSEERLDEVGINQVNAVEISSNRRESTYRVMNVSQDDQFFCILFKGLDAIGAISVTEVVYRLPSISDPPTELTRTTRSLTITWRPWNEETDVGDPPVLAYIPYYKMDPSQDWMSGSRIQADQTLEYTASSLESDRNYTFSVAAVRDGEGGKGPRGPAVTIKTLCIDVVPQMVTTTLTATNDVTVTWQQPTVQCSTGITQFTIYYEIEGDVSSRKEAGRENPNAESFTIDGSLLEPGMTYNIAVTVTTDQESALSEGSSVTRAVGEPPSSPVYLVALVIPVLLIIILLVVIIKRIQRKPESEPKPVDVQDVDYVNAGVTDDPGDYIALEEQSKNTPAPKYQDLTEKEAPTQVSGYERTILETADAAPKAMPHQGLKRQTDGDYQYEDVNLGETDARKLPSVPQPDLQSEDDTEYEVPDMFEEYTGVHMNTLGASKPITPRPMKITEYKTFMGRERSKVISEIAQQYMALKTGQQHPWTAAVKLQNKPTNFFKALLPYDHSRVRLDTDGSDVRSDYINASYIKNHQGKVSFIAAQGPREGTKDDFWRMVWKEDVETIVMLVDKDGTEQHSKDAQYWPEVNRNQKYGAITVLLMETTAFRRYILREMNVIKGNERVHTVRQYEIPCWKYGGVPSEPADLISVIKQIKSDQKGGKHLLVHCSNGVGATGAFIGLYDLMDVIKTKKEVSVFDVIEGMRKDRVNMVLTKLQYLFIFDALLEAMLSPDSQVSCDQLKKLDLSAMKAKCKKEFQILQETTKHQEDLATLAGNSSENNHKNRFPDLLPVDKFRPVLKSPSNLFGSNDYINATFVKDISQRGFIMTQSPLASTIEDIWRLVFDFDCTSMVMLNTVDDSDESLTVYWPIGHNAASSHGLMTVICKKIEESDVFTRRQFEVKHKRSQKSLLVDHFSFHGCLGSKADVHKLREFIKYTRTKGTGPALVHCINGVGFSAIYVTVISELERIEKEGAVDVFRTLHRLRKQCPHAVQTQDEYLLCYELLRDHLNNPEEYAVVF